MYLEKTPKPKGEYANSTLTRWKQVGNWTPNPRDVTPATAIQWDSLNCQTPWSVALTFELCSWLRRTPSFCFFSPLRLNHFNHWVQAFVSHVVLVLYLTLFSGLLYMGCSCLLLPACSLTQTMMTIIEINTHVCLISPLHTLQLSYMQSISTAEVIMTLHMKYSVEDWVTCFKRTKKSQC